MLALHHYPGNASMIPHILLHELKRAVRAQAGQSHAGRAQVARLPEAQSQRSDPGARRRSPGAVRDGGDLPAPGRHPPAGRLGAGAGHAAARSLLQVADLDDQLAAGDDGPATSTPSARSTTATRRGRAGAQPRAGAHRRACSSQLDAQLASHGQPWLLGATYSALDPYAFDAVPLDARLQGAGARPARESAQLGPYLQRMLARPAVQRVLADEKAGAALGVAPCASRGLASDRATL